MASLTFYPEDHAQVKCPHCKKNFHVYFNIRETSSEKARRHDKQAAMCTKCKKVVVIEGSVIINMAVYAFVPKDKPI